VARIYRDAKAFERAGRVCGQVGQLGWASPEFRSVGGELVFGAEAQVIPAALGKVGLFYNEGAVGFDMNQIRKLLRTSGIAVLEKIHEFLSRDGSLESVKLRPVRWITEPCDVGLGRSRGYFRISECRK
jgi:hypothetical protein